MDLKGEYDNEITFSSFLYVIAPRLGHLWNDLVHHGDKLLSLEKHFYLYLLTK